MFLRLKVRFLDLMRMSALRQAMRLTLVFLFVVVVAGLSAIYLTSHELDKRIQSELRSTHAQISQRIIVSEFDPDTFRFSENHVAVFQGADGTTIGPAIPLSDDLFGLSIIKFDTKKGGDGHRWKTYVNPVAGGVLLVGRNLGDRDEYLEILWGVFLTTGILILGISIIGGVFFGLQAQKRLSAITSKLKQIAEGDLSVRIGTTPAGDDFDQLSGSINQTTAKIEVLVRQIRSLTTNIAHDLKTPLTRLRGLLEVLEQRPEDQKTVEAALGQTDHIIEMFEALLRIARLESGQHRAEFQTIDLGEFASEMAEIYQAVVEDKGYEFALKVHNTSLVRGDRGLLMQAIANLVENSLKHTPAGGVIKLEVSGNCIGLSDTGPGIPEDQYERVLEPMFRLETSRTTPGSGLGLAQVKTIASLHGCRLILSKNPNPGVTGLKVVLEFPYSSK